MTKVRWRCAPSILPFSNTQCSAPLSPLSKSLRTAWQQGRHRLSHQPVRQSCTIPSALLLWLTQPYSSHGWCRVHMRDLLFSSLTISLCWNASLPTNNLGGSGKWSCGVSENSRALFRFCHAIIKRLPLEYGTDLSKPVNNAFFLVESLWLPTEEKPVVY